MNVRHEKDLVVGINESFHLKCAARTMRPAEPNGSMWRSQLGSCEVLKHCNNQWVAVWFHPLIHARESREYPKAWLQKVNVEPLHVSLWFALQNLSVHWGSSRHIAALIQFSRLPLFVLNWRDVTSRKQTFYSFYFALSTPRKAVWRSSLQSSSATKKWKRRLCREEGWHRTTRARGF